MKVLLDTNIIIHRETDAPINDDIGHLFRWIDNLGYQKYLHPVTVSEIAKNKNKKIQESFGIKLNSYNVLKTVSEPDENYLDCCSKYDATENDKSDSLILLEVYNNRVDCLITEDRKLHKKADELSISSKVFTIDSFLEKVNQENPTLKEYKVLSVKKAYFGNINLKDKFFDSFRNDYKEFDSWFNTKAEEMAYVCYADTALVAFLYIKKEGVVENYSKINPIFEPGIRLKIGTFKVASNGYKLGERFLKIIFDNAVLLNVDELYLTIFENTFDQQRLIRLIEEWGFKHFGFKTTNNGKEKVFVRKLLIKNWESVKEAYPFIPTKSSKFLLPIRPEYHTNLLPDSILRTENAIDFIDNEPFRNAIQKAYISRSVCRNIKAGDLIVFYRTASGGKAFYTSVVTTIGLIVSKSDNIKNQYQFIQLCKKRSVFTDAELIEWWNAKPTKPFIINFLYVYSFPKRLNLQKLIELQVIKNTSGAPQGLVKITDEQFFRIFKESKSDESLIVD